ncbi:Nucleotide-binding universal stress protein, UspA family [Marivirga sericea]|uniref:Nucleotide-binding universal stress protein, UspA family n=1 Tax=Marivirga sericea TaxID=1028 RepID=A0A1X7I8K1_9BACT|nr:universal stress protein [Marivirga sericea]SMG10884.1 Nucleotide-binding universal stress protein, UspA family [Marivirga sericea]
MIKHILVPTDFSDCAMNALEYALKFAKHINPQAEITILNAYTVPLAYADFNIAYDVGESVEDIKKFIDSEFDKIEEKVPMIKDFEYEPVKTENYVKDAVEEFCLENDVDLIIMGTKGASGVDEVILGTNAHRVIKAEVAPVLVIPEDARYVDIKNIALSSDYKGIIAELLSPVKAIRQAYASEIHLIHVSAEPMLDKEKAEEAKNLELHLKGLPHQYHFMVNRNVESGIDEFAERNRIDLLVVLPRKKGLFESLFARSESKSLIFHTKVPLLALSSSKRKIIETD